jgi:hypothetical protein
MAIPYRGVTGKGTYFITSGTYLKKSLFQSDRMANCFSGRTRELPAPAQIPAP